MEISTRFRDNVAILDIKGDIVKNSRFVLNEHIQEQIDDGIFMIILNLEEVPMMDSVALGVIIAGLTQLIKKYGKLVLLNVGRSVRYLLVVTQLDQYFEKYDDEDKALESFGEKERR